MKIRRWMGRKHICLVMVLLLMISVLGGCNTLVGDANKERALAWGFATYQETPVKVKPALKPYQVASDLSNITNRDQFILGPRTRELLRQNGFAVVPGSSQEFFELYDGNDGIPNFVTTDAMLHTYHLFFSRLLKNTEQEFLVGELKKLNSAMLATSQEHYDSLKGTSWEHAAKRNLAFFGVASRLIDSQAKVPALVGNEVEQELALIKQHRGIAASPVMNIGPSARESVGPLQEDYTQYIPRGHYTQSTALQDYFKTMMWYGRLTFRAASEDETRSAVLITLALNEPETFRSWEKIYEPTSFFVGKSDDSDYYAYRKLLEQVYGNGVTLSQVINDTARWTALRREIAKLQPPAIISIPIPAQDIRPGAEEETKGFRFMGQRFTLDASVFQQLIYDKVKENHQGMQRLLPRGLDIPAAMGSAEAYALLQQMGETGYQGYPENMSKIKQHISGLEQTTWTQNLYWNWLYTLLPLTEEKTAGYPTFMLNKAWVRKELNTYLGSWTELKHDTILYAKQAYAKCGSSPTGREEQGYVEPNPQVYARLASLIDMTGAGLESRGLLNNRDKDNLQRMQQLALDLKAIAEKELNGTALSSQDYDIIRNFGGELRRFWQESVRSDEPGDFAEAESHPAPVVTDVATDPWNSRVLEEGTGTIGEILVVVPNQGKLQIARGGVYSYYEFHWPAADRLTDEKWRAMLDQDKVPQPPAWTAAFTVR